jgi:hypothetical protein
MMEPKEILTTAVQKIREQALKEIAEEAHRAAVDAIKEDIRRHVPWHVRIFPWKITITRRS